MMNFINKHHTIPENIVNMFGGRSAVEKMKSQALDSILNNIVDALYNEFPNGDRTQLFIKDPRRSEKEQVIMLLLNKAVPKVLNKMSEEDISSLFNKIQVKKE